MSIASHAVIRHMVWFADLQGEIVITSIAVGNVNARGVLFLVIVKGRKYTIGELLPRLAEPFCIGKADDILMMAPSRPGDQATQTA